MTTVNKARHNPPFGGWTSALRSLACAGGVRRLEINVSAS